MTDVEISYKGSQIASMSASGVKTLLTGDSFCEDDIVVSYTKPSASGSLNITNNGTYDITNYAEVVVSVSVPIEYIDYTYTVSGSTQTWNLGKSPNQIKALLDQGKIVFVQIPDGSYTQVFGCTRSSSSSSTYWLMYIAKIYESDNIYAALRAIPSYTANGINGTFSYAYTSGGSND